MARISIRLLPDEHRAVIKTARLEHREQREQVAFLVREALIRRGLLTADANAHGEARKADAPIGEVNNAHANA